MRRREPSEVLSRLVDRKTARLPYARAGRVEGRNTDGTTRLRFLEGNCEARLGITGARKGEVVLAEPSGLRSRGTAGVPRASFAAGRSALWVERLETDAGDGILCLGQEQLVTVVGRGFTAATRFDFLLPDSREVHPGISILEQTWIDAEHVELRVFVDPNAPSDEVRAPLAYG